MIGGGIAIGQAAVFLRRLPSLLPDIANGTEDDIVFRYLGLLASMTRPVEGA